jgi:integrase
VRHDVVVASETHDDVPPAGFEQVDPVTAWRADVGRRLAVACECVRGDARAESKGGRLVRAAGLPHVRFHDLRHGYATALLRQNVHPKIVSEALGHTSVGFTLDTYSHVVPSMQVEAAASSQVDGWAPGDSNPEPAD